MEFPTNCYPKCAQKAQATFARQTWNQRVRQCSSKSLLGEWTVGVIEACIFFSGSKQIAGIGSDRNESGLRLRAYRRIILSRLSEAQGDSNPCVLAEKASVIQVLYPESCGLLINCFVSKEKNHSIRTKFRQATHHWMPAPWRMVFFECPRKPCWR